MPLYKNLNDFRNKLYKLRRYSVEAVAAYNTELNDLSDKLEKAYKEKGEAETILRNEYEKLNEYSADISNFESLLVFEKHIQSDKFSHQIGCVLCSQQ